jgi:hypothetical protein
LTKGTKYTVRQRKVGDYLPDSTNANRGTRRGRQMLTASYQRNGAGRSWLVDKDGQLIAGNHAREAALAAGIDDVVEIEVHDPRVQVVVRRPDLDLDGADQRARELAFADNRTSETGLAWSPEEIEAHEQLLRDANLFRDDELDELKQMGMAEDTVDDAVTESTTDGRATLKGTGGARISPVLYLDDLEAFEDAISIARKLTGEQRRGALVAHICRAFIDAHVDEDVSALLDG